jgi:hypothetical protein
MPSVIYNISLWRATTVKHRRVDTSLPWSAETRQNDNGERGARPLRARINLLSSRISCCCGLDATHKGGKEEEEGFRCWPFFFLSSLFAVCHKTFFFWGGAVWWGSAGYKVKGIIFLFIIFLIFLVESKWNWKISSDRISIWFVGRQWDEIRWRWIPFFAERFQLQTVWFLFTVPFFFSFLLHSWSIDNLIMASPLVSLEWMQQGNRLPFNRADEGRMGEITRDLARISHNELR